MTMTEDSCMNRTITLLVTGTLMSSVPRAVSAQQPSRPNAVSVSERDGIDDATRTAVLAARDVIWRAWFAHDTAALRRLLPRSTTAGGADGWESRDEIVAGSLRSAASGRRLVAIRFDDTRIHVNGNVAVVFSTYTMDLESQGQRNTVTGRASEVFVRTDDGIWQNPFWYLGPR